MRSHVDSDDSLLMRRAASPTWSDGIHFVRKASPNDSHTMPWYVGAHRVTASAKQRWAETRDEAIRFAAAATVSWLRKHPEDRTYYKAPVPPASRKGHMEAPPPFATTNFDCIEANPYAQVWECQAEHGMGSAPVGRRAKDGSLPKQAPFRHKLHQCAVMIGREPIRDPDGQVSVFSGAAAKELAYDLYRDAPPDEVISWTPGNKAANVEPQTRVGGTRRVDVMFDPVWTRSQRRPFYLYLPEHRRPVYEDRTRPTYYAEDTRPKGSLVGGGQAQIDREQRLKERQAIDRQPSFEERLLTFRSIWAAEEEAERRERMLEGRVV